jgi:predicted phosphoribosyltransferase
VIGLPRGGVVTAYYVATELGLPLDVIVARKIGCPFHEELALGTLFVKKLKNLCSLILEIILRADMVRTVSKVP